jgi:flagellar biogenesis protein FliO
MQSPRNSPSLAPHAKWVPLAIIGLVAVAAGVLLPRFLPSSAPATTSAADNSKAKLSEKPPAPVENPSGPPTPSPARTSAPNPTEKPTPNPDKPAATSPATRWTYDAPDWAEPPNHQAMFLRLGLGTAIVLALCVGTVYLCKRWLRGAPAQASANGRLQLIETLALGQRCWLQLVHVAGQPVLVGGDPAGLKTIVPLPESFAATLAEKTEETPPAGLATILAQRFTTHVENGDGPARDGDRPGGHRGADPRRPEE